jgi:hypothetical protein
MCCTFKFSQTHNVIKGFLVNSVAFISERIKLEGRLLILGLPSFLAHKRMMVNGEDREVTVLSCIL